jgi:signal transduction histidine kinase
MRLFLLFALLFLRALPGTIAATPDTLLQKGIDLYEKGEYEKSIEVLQRRLEIAIRKNEKGIQEVIYNSLGNNYCNTGKTVEALKAYQTSITLAEALKDKQSIARTTKNIGALYSDTKDFEKALKKYDEAEEIARSINDTLTFADCANNKGLIFEQQKKYTEALNEYNKALALYQAMGHKGRLALLYNNIGIVYKYLGDYEHSIEFYERSMVISEQLGDKFMVAANEINIGNVYEMQGDYKKAIEMNEKGQRTGRDINSQELIIETYDNMAEAYSKSGDYRAGFQMYKKYVAAKDSFISIERSKQMAEMQTRYETEKKEKQIVALEKTRYQMLAVIGIMVLLIVIGYLLYNRQQIQQKQAREKAILEAEYKERMRIAKDVHDDLGSGLSKISLVASLAQKRAADNQILRDEIHNISELSRSLTEKLAGKPLEAGREHLSAHLQELGLGLSKISMTAQIAEQKAASNIDLGKDIHHIASMSKDLIDNMRDLIWVLNPENTTLDNLVARLREYCADYLEGLDIKTILDFPATVSPIRISREAQRNIFSTVKEVLNNSIKHASPTEITVAVKTGDKEFSIEARDNGTGINFDDLKGTGNGLRNMRQRIEAIGGNFSIISAKKTGTLVSINIPIEKLNLLPYTI